MAAAYRDSALHHCSVLLSLQVTMCLDAQLAHVTALSFTLLSLTAGGAGYMGKGHQVTPDDARLTAPPHCSSDI